MEKNVSEIVRVAEDCPEYEFVIVGEGPRREPLQATAPDNVEFRDFLPREELPTFYSSIDAFITASTADTLGLSTLEANACGTPVVAADVPPFDRTIGSENGARFPYGDRNEMAAAIESTLTSAWETRSAIERYDIQKTIVQLEQLYRSAPHSRDASPVTGETPWQPSTDE